MTNWKLLGSNFDSTWKQYKQTNKHANNLCLCDRVKLKDDVTFLGAKATNPVQWTVSQDVRSEGHRVVTLHCRRKDISYSQRSVTLTFQQNIYWALILITFAVWDAANLRSALCEKEMHFKVVFTLGTFAAVWIRVLFFHSTTHSIDLDSESLDWIEPFAFIRILYTEDNPYLYIYLLL